MELRQIALGMVQQVQRKCPNCTDGYRCKTKKERKVLEVHVEKGMKNGEKVTFRGMAMKSLTLKLVTLILLFKRKNMICSSVRVQIFLLQRP